MKNCPPGVKCGGSWTKRMMLTKSSGGGGEPSPGYGLLYNWYAATDVRGIAPDGWRVPSKTDYDTMFTSLGGISLSGGKIKSVREIADGDPYWNSPNVDASNESELNGFAGGIRSGLNGAYSNLRESLALWTTTPLGPPNIGWNPRIFRSQAAAIFTNENYKLGASIRCVRDTAPSSSTVNDADGNEYTWVQIGSQYWLKQSLKTTRYNNGDLIPTGLDNAAWAATTDGAWAYPNGDSNLPI